MLKWWSWYGRVLLKNATLRLATIVATNYHGDTCYHSGREILHSSTALVHWDGCIVVCHDFHYRISCNVVIVAKVGILLFVTLIHKSRRSHDLTRTATNEYPNTKQRQGLRAYIQGKIQHNVAVSARRKVVLEQQHRTKYCECTGNTCRYARNSSHLSPLFPHTILPSRL